MPDDDHSARLDEFDKIEWRDVSRQMAPEMTDEEFDVAWAEFVRQKALRAAH